jgi:hypothetical protein
VADSIPDRIKKLIYLDAFFPENNESVFNITNETVATTKRSLENGFILPTWLKPGTPLPHDVPHPLKTFTDTLILKGNSAKMTGVYILTVDKGKEASTDGFFAQSERARKKGWPVLILEADHNPQWSAPLQLSELLFQNK